MTDKRHFESFDHLTTHIRRNVDVRLYGDEYEEGWALGQERDASCGNLELISVHLEYYPEDCQYLNGLYYYFDSIQDLEQEMANDWGQMSRYMTREDVAKALSVMNAFADVEYTVDLGRERTGIWKGFRAPPGISAGTRARAKEVGVRRFNKRKYWSQEFILEGGEPFEKHVTFYFHPNAPVRYTLPLRTLEGVEAGRETLARMRTFLDRLELIERLIGTEAYK